MDRLHTRCHVRHSAWLYLMSCCPLCSSGMPPSSVRRAALLPTPWAKAQGCSCGVDADRELGLSTWAWQLTFPDICYSR